MEPFYKIKVGWLGRRQATQRFLFCWTCGAELFIEFVHCFEDPGTTPLLYVAVLSVANLVGRGEKGAILSLHGL